MMRQPANHSMDRTSRSDGTGAALTSIAVTSGKGGVGKTNVAINLAVALARLRHRVALLDADFGLGNVDVLLGLAPTVHLGHMFAGERNIRDILIPGPRGVTVIPASSGLRGLTALTPHHWNQLTSALDSLADDFDYLVIDTPAGISNNVFESLALAQQVMVVTSLEPSAVVDAYAMVKLVSAAVPAREIGLLVNDVHDASEADLVFRQLDMAATRFLRRRLTYFGFVTHDPAVRESALAQRPIVDHVPQSPASRCFRILASKYAAMHPHRGPGLRLVSSIPGMAPKTAAGSEASCA